MSVPVTSKVIQRNFDNIDIIAVVQVLGTEQTQKYQGNSSKLGRIIKVLREPMEKRASSTDPTVPAFEYLTAWLQMQQGVLSKNNRVC